MKPALSNEQCHQARLAKDSRFDGAFFTAVKSTGIFCRPICPARAPKEENVEYFATAAGALHAGYRPCLRCRPDSAPGSSAWLGTQTSVKRAMQLIESGALNEQSIPGLAERLGMGERHLRNLFQQHVGLSPKAFATCHQLLFAKQLLHNSNLAIAEIAYASGFGSVRRFNDAFKQQIKLTPSQLRGNQQNQASTEQQLNLTLKTPFNWQQLLDFYRLRAVDGIEQVTEHSYRRSVRVADSHGWFEASYQPKQKDNVLQVRFELSDLVQLRPLISQVRRLFDLDADTQRIESDLKQTPLAPYLTEGIRIPGVWSAWEAGVRAILGQQVSVKAAITQLNRLVASLNQHRDADWYFPTPEELINADLSVLKMPAARRETLARFAHFIAEHGDQSPKDWLTLKGIGPWTVNYARLRGLSEPDCFLATDLIVKKVLSSLPAITADAVSPWGSYATFHCWHSYSSGLN
ncbi:AlkA N-terminal domain-containing protein [Reinekea thalattae]|uniref:DNA-3-methyladenine glycosylase II n=1 Tax=Reinekea thalattae TaxID=2593301 RepID=A0A5C8ZBL6_9GAMM|nr:AlkA N-terminal domain-containing protein [Reinekea thalattae]TXR54561.1 DNA-3-methyladenine glycosylase 2 family protein [Reinekea thalattae]